jgi:Tol biopolymer transport system component
VGGENVYVMRRDGTELKSLTASGNIPADARPYIMDGWLVDGVILRSVLPGKEGTVYLVRAADGHVRPLFDTFLTKSALVPSPDGTRLAFDEYDSQAQEHTVRVINASGTLPLDLAAFTGGSLFPMVWSSDGAQLAFAHTAFDAGGHPTAGVYLIGRDGLEPRQIYQGVTVGRLVFSPDGKFLLVEETRSISGGHLFVVNLDTLAAHILEAPGLTLDTDWYAPSWRP